LIKGENSYICTGDQFDSTVVSSRDKCGENHLSIGVLQVDPETIGQFSGITDKNGKKIFEGDKDE